MQILSKNESICKDLAQSGLMVDPLPCLNRGKTMPLVRIDVCKGKDIANQILTRKVEAK
jgi:hypothetical protein